MNGCNTDRCAYGGGSDADETYNNYSVCNKPECEYYYFCAECKQAGAHRRHRKYLRTYIYIYISYKKYTFYM